MLGGWGVGQCEGAEGRVHAGQTTPAAGDLHHAGRSAEGASEASVRAVVHCAGGASSGDEPGVVAELSHQLQVAGPGDEACAVEQVHLRVLQQPLEDGYLRCGKCSTV